MTGASAAALDEVVAIWGHPQVRGPAPPPRVGHCAARMGEQSLLLFGGFSTVGGYSNALYTLNVERLQWSQPVVHCTHGAVPPLPRLGASVTALHAYVAILFGGSHDGLPCANLDRITARSDLTEPHTTLDIQQPQQQGRSPAPRFNHCAALLGTTDLIVFGGSGGGDGTFPQLPVMAAQTATTCYLLTARSLSSAAYDSPPATYAVRPMTRHASECTILTSGFNP